MQSFKQFLQERTWASNKQKIVMLYADHDTQQRMVSWCVAQGFDLTKKFDGSKIEPRDFQFHCTVVASKNPVMMPTGQNMVKPVHLKAKKFKELGVHKRVPTIEFDVTEQLNACRQYFIENDMLEMYGIQPTFENFIAHMSLSYAWTGQPKLERLKLPTFPIVLNQIVIKDFTP